ncbi:hypothetical protein FW778_04045 [Ginsengibacter hankyongi]|uniref:Outer membrane protein beta-barrel domain-containing protein n=1 Tax=Ginsengibacter hankyongi TaxID=2607284 RepID=A0A5J5IJH8_9BACT|nr:hypothetical protein [Ginsengibacter hankyongi]KAA9041215.1 hypothetical protein FW778_04045 [Ginsengibacter hankyongi]
MKLLVTGIFILLIFFAPSINAQPFFAVSAGISKDLNNKKTFYAAPVTFRWKLFKHSGFFIEATNEIGFNRLTHADAYTANAQLPEHVVLTEKVRPSAFSMGIGGAIRLYTNKKNNQLTLNLSLGICDEYFAISYRNYDKVNYEVLNPDVAKDFSGVYAAIAGVYNFHKRKQDMFIMLRLQSPSSAGPGDRYVLSYDQTAPVQLTFGYNLFYKKL